MPENADQKTPALATGVSLCHLATTPSECLPDHDVVHFGT